MERLKHSNQLQVLLKEYPVIAAADLTKVRSSQIHELRKRLRDRVTMLVAKKQLVAKGGRSIGGQEQRMGEFVKDLTGSNILLLTQINPFRLVILLEKKQDQSARKRRRHRPQATSWIPAGNTSIPPGPVIGEFGEIRVPTRIEGGSIWVAQRHSSCIER